MTPEQIEFDFIGNIEDCICNTNKKPIVTAILDNSAVPFTVICPGCQRKTVERTATQQEAVNIWNEMMLELTKEG